MKKESENDKRKQKRWELRQYLRVFDLKTDGLIGHLADINMAGMKLVSGGPIQAGEDYSLIMKIMREKVGFEAQSIWCKRDGKADLYNTGFRLLNPDPGVITNIQCLIEALRALQDVQSKNNLQQ